MSFIVVVRSAAASETEQCWGEEGERNGRSRSCWPAAIPNMSGPSLLTSDQSFISVSPRGVWPTELNVLCRCLCACAKRFYTISSEAEIKRRIQHHVETDSDTSVMRLRAPDSVQKSDFSVKTAALNHLFFLRYRVKKVKYIHFSEGLCVQVEDTQSFRCLDLFFWLWRCLKRLHNVSLPTFIFAEMFAGCHSSVSQCSALVCWELA